MTTPAPRQFKSLDLSKIKSAVGEVAKENDVPKLVHPSVPAVPAISDDASPALQLTPAKRAARKNNPAPVKRVAVDLPDYLVKAITKQHAEQGVTKRYLYLQAFRAAGYTVNDVDMLEDGRREA